MSAARVVGSVSTPATRAHEHLTLFRFPHRWSGPNAQPIGLSAPFSRRRCGRYGFGGLVGFGGFVGGFVGSGGFVGVGVPVALRVSVGFGFEVGVGVLNRVAVGDATSS